MELDLDIRLEVLRDHDLRPRNYEALEAYSSRGYNYNPRCGDKYTVYLVTEGDTLAKVRFMGWGCAVSKASASIMCAAMEGLTLQQARHLLHQFQKMVQGESHQLDPETHFDLLAFDTIHQNPLRQTCALLAWHALQEALGGLAIANP